MGMMKQCVKMGTMSTCKELVYEFPDPEEQYCYYHVKVRDGLISNNSDDVYIIGGSIV